MKVKVFVTAFFQVLFVSANAFFISRLMFLPIFICGFMISMLWTLNVKSISIAGWGDRLTYSFGAAIGGIVGVWISFNITT